MRLTFADYFQRSAKASHKHRVCNIRHGNAATETQAPSVTERALRRTCRVAPM